MAILIVLLSSALDRSAIFLTDLAGRTVKNLRSPRGPGINTYPVSANKMCMVNSCTYKMAKIGALKSHFVYYSYSNMHLVH